VKSSSQEKFSIRCKKFIDHLPTRFIDKINEIFSDPQNLKALGLWTSAVVAALISVAYAKLFHFAETGFDKISSKSSYVVFILSPICFLLAWWMVRRFSPEAAGSGIPQIMAANEIDYSGEKSKVVDRLLSLRTAAIKIISSLLCVAGGGAIGREGPTLQICASVFHFFGKQVRRKSFNIDEHTWVVAGAAAGLASAFNTPLGGIVYAIEELGLVHFHKVRTALISGVIASGLVAQWILGSYLYLGFPKLNSVSFSFLPIAILNGAITGIAGALFGRLLLFFLNKRLLVTKTTHLVLITMGCGLVVAVLSMIDNRSSGAGINVITGFLFNDQEAGLPLLVIRYIGTTVSYLSGAAGGIFSPSLAMGATIGSYLSKFIAADHANLMVMLGMIGFLTGVTHTPFTSFILVLEMTDRHSAIFPMMLAGLTAQWASSLIDRNSFYEHVKEKYIAPIKIPVSERE